MNFANIFRKSPVDGVGSVITLDQAQRQFAAAEVAEAEAEELLRATPGGTPRWRHARRCIEAAAMQRRAIHFVLACSQVRDVAPRARKIAQQAHAKARTSRDAAHERRMQLGERALGLNQRVSELQNMQAQHLATHRQSIADARAALAVAVDGESGEAEIAAAQAVEDLLRRPPDAPDSALQLQIGAVNARRGTLSQEIASADHAVIEAEAALARATADLHGIDRDLTGLAAMEAALQYAVISGESFAERSPATGDVYCIGRSSILFEEAGPMARFLVDRHEAVHLEALANSMRPAWGEVLAIDPSTLSAEPEPEPLSPQMPAGVYSSHAAQLHFGE